MLRPANYLFLHVHPQAEMSKDLVDYQAEVWWGTGNVGLKLSGSLSNLGKTSNKEPWHNLRPWRPQGPEAGLSVGTNSFSCQINQGKLQPVWPVEQCRAQDLTSLCADPSNKQMYWFSSQSLCPFFRDLAPSKILTVNVLKPTTSKYVFILKIY